MRVTSESSLAVIPTLVGLFAQLHQDAAMGSAFGCFFFLFTSSLLKPAARIYLLIFSWGLGYSAGLFWSVDPLSKAPMGVAAVVSALAAALFTAFYHIIQKDGDVPPWLKSIFDMFTTIKGKG